MVVDHVDDETKNYFTTSKNFPVGNKLISFAKEYLRVIKNYFRKPWLNMNNCQLFKFLLPIIQTLEKLKSLQNFIKVFRSVKLEPGGNFFMELFDNYGTEYHGEKTQIVVSIWIAQLFGIITHSWIKQKRFTVHLR